MNFIAKIFRGEKDEWVHLQFQKFSKGEFRDKAVINAKKSKERYTISTGPEFANELVREVAKKLGDEKTIVKGAVISTLDLKEELTPKDVKQFQGVKRHLIEKEMSGKEILNLLKKFPKVFFALSFSAKHSELKIKPKAPKSGKPSTKAEQKPKANFCKLKTNDKEIVKSFILEVNDFNKAEITHHYFIDEIIIPDEFKGETDYKLVREKALRKGRIIREAFIDGETIKKEKEFVA